MCRNKFFSRPLILACVIAFTATTALSQEDDQNLPSDLTSVGLERLLNFDLSVTLSSRKAEQLSHAASAISVITHEDIQRSGATHIAEALRLIPGVNVARVASNRWAISIRGFNQIFSNKLLVLVDGVSIFSPTTNGVYWEANELLLEDVERIEVVRGPGAALWGANAVNGVINIITKSPKDTKGGLVTAGIGNVERGLGAIRYGGEISSNTDYRAYAVFNDRDELTLKNGDGAQDDWQSGSTGIRIDSSITSNDSVSFTTDVQRQWDSLTPTVPSLTPPYTDSITFSDRTQWSGVRSALKWGHTFSDESQLSSILSYQRKERSSSLISFDYDILNLDMQHQTQLGESHSIVYGGYARYFSNSSEGSNAQAVQPENRDTTLWSVFFHDEIAVAPNNLKLIIGSKFEHNESTGLELMPNARLVYIPTKTVTGWIAVSRAVAPPALFFEDSQIPVQAFPVPDAGIPGLVTVVGNRNLESENLLAYEAGGRLEVSSEFSVDTALFFNSYDDIYSAEPGNPNVGFSSLGSGGPALEIPLNLSNNLKADSYGVELAAEWRPNAWFSMYTSYSYLRVDVEKADSLDTGNPNLIEGGAPFHQANLRSSIKLTSDISTDATLRYVDNLSWGKVPSYVELDLGLNYKISKTIELGVYGQNLLDNDHQEFLPNLFGLPETEIGRSVFGKIRWFF